MSDRGSAAGGERRDRGHRGEGIVHVALDGALEQIAGAGGGRVEATSETTADRTATAGSCSPRRPLEAHGFDRGRRVGSTPAS